MLMSGCATDSRLVQSHSLDSPRPDVELGETPFFPQVELVAAIRRYGRVPYEIEPSLSSLTAELQAGRPVLVLQNLGIKIAPLWHYAVVVGYSPE